MLAFNKMLKVNCHKSLMVHISLQNVWFSTRVERKSEIHTHEWLTSIKMTSMMYFTLESFLVQIVERMSAYFILNYNLYKATNHNEQRIIDQTFFNLSQFCF